MTELKVYLTPRSRIKRARLAFGGTLLLFIVTALFGGRYGHEGMLFNGAWRSGLMWAVAGIFFLGLALPGAYARKLKADMELMAPVFEITSEGILNQEMGLLPWRTLNAVRAAGQRLEIDVDHTAFPADHPIIQYRMSDERLGCIYTLKTAEWNMTAADIAAILSDNLTAPHA